jgi:hypothetical protein
VNNVKKVTEASFPPKGMASFRRALSRWRARIKKDHPDLVIWADYVVGDEDIFSALLELVCWHKISPEDLLGFLQEQRKTQFPEREFRKRLREGGKKWKTVERLAAKARNETEPLLAELAEKAVEVEALARLLSKSLIAPVSHRPFEENIAVCKNTIVAFLKRRNVREVNQYGWILLRAIFGDEWKPGWGKDPIEAFRSIRNPFAGKIKTRKDVKVVMERAKVGWFRMRKPEK